MSLITAGAHTTATSGNETATSITQAKPAAAAGDVLIWAISLRVNGTGTAAGTTYTAPAGWTVLSDITDAGSPPNQQIVAWKLSDGTTSNETWTFTNPAGGTGNGIAAAMQAYSGVNRSAPSAGVAGQAEPSTTATATHSTPGATPTTDSCWAVGVFSGRSGSTWTPPTGYTERADVQNTGTSATVELTDSAGIISQTSTSAAATASGTSTVAVATLLFLAPAGNPLTSSLLDTFDGTTTSDTAWDWTSGGTISGGAAHIPPTNSYPVIQATPTSGSGTTAQYYTLDTLVFEIAQVPTILAGSGGDPTKLSLEVGIIDPTTAGNQIVAHFSGGTSTTPGNVSYENRVGYTDPAAVVDPYVAATMGYIRFRLSSDGAFVYIEMSPEGVFWRTRYSFAAPSWVANCRPNISAFYLGTGGTISDAIVDRVNMAPPPYAANGAGLASGGTKNADRGKLAHFQDSFASGTGNTFPGFNYAAMSSSVTVVAGTPNTLRLTPVAGATKQWIQSNATWDLTSSSVTWEVTQIGSGMSPGAQAGFEVKLKSGVDGTELVVKYTQDGNISYENRVGGVDAAAVTEAFSTASFPWARIREDGSGHTMFELSADGATGWVTKKTISTPAWAYAVQPQINAISGTATGTSTSNRLALWNEPPGFTPYTPPSAGAGLGLTNAGKLATLTEQFAGTTPSSKWAMSNGARQQDAAICPAQTNVPTFATTASYDATASSGYVSVTPPLVNTGEAVIVLVSNADPTKYLEIRFTNAGNLSATKVDGTTTAIVSRAASTSGSDAIVKVSEAAGTVTLATSADGVSYSTLGTTATPSWWSDVQVRLEGSLPSGTSTSLAVFDNFNTTATVATGHPLASSVSDAFNGTSLDASKWQVAGGTVNVNNEIEITAQPGSPVTMTSVSQYQLDSAWMKLRAATLTPGDVTTFSALSASSGTGAQFALTSNQVIAKNLIGGVDSAPVAVAVDNTVPLWCRFRVGSVGTAQNQLIWETSKDNVSYTLLRNVNAPSWVSSVFFQAGVTAPTQSTPIPPTTGGGTGGTGGTGGGGGTTGGGSTGVTTTAPPSGKNVTVDLRVASRLAQLDKWSIGATISTYSNGRTDNNINKSATWRSKLAALGPIAWRIPLAYQNGNPGSSAGGAQSTGDAVTYNNNIAAMGGVMLPVLGGDTSDNGVANSDVTGFVNYFNAAGAGHGAKIERLVFGNEPENGGTTEIANYKAALPGWISAARAADSTVKLIAPAASYWDSALVQWASQNAALDGLCYHAYDGANTTGEPGFPTTSQYHDHVVTMLGYLTAGGSTMVGSIVGVEEVNYHSNDTKGTSAFEDYHNAVWLASVIGQVLSAGPAGAKTPHFNQYSDANGLLGLLNDGTTGHAANQPGYVSDTNRGTGTPYPAYWAIGMWTGMNGTFKGAPTLTGGYMQPASSTLTNLDAFAMADASGSGAKVMLINKDGSNNRSCDVAVGGRDSGTYEIWQTVQTTSGVMPAPTKVASGSYAGSLIPGVVCPAGTVTSITIA